MVDNPAPVLTTATDQQAQRLETSIKEFASEKKQNAFVSEIDVIGGPGKAFAIIFLTQQEADYLRQNLGYLAQMGIIVAIGGSLYKDLSRGDRNSARMLIKDFTRHNDKLGFDFDNKSRKYKASLSSQFQGSSYPRFLERAAEFYEGSYPALAAHFTDAMGKFDIGPAQRDKLVADQGRAVSLPVEEGAYQRVIQGLQQKIDNMSAREEKLQEDAYLAMDHTQVLERKIRGYEGKAIVDPQKMVDFPMKLRDNLQSMFQHLNDGEETRYVKSLVDPFHPDCTGVRVPTLLPRDTAVFHMYNSMDIGHEATGKTRLLIAGLEQSTKHQAVSILVDDDVFNTTPTKHNVRQRGSVDDQLHEVHGILIGQVDEIDVKTIVDDTPTTLFTKHRTVSTGVRFFKTSASESESGQLDMFYSRDGANIDEAATFNQMFNRPSRNSQRVYLAGNYGPLRGRVGFISQCNYRPHDMQSFEFHDTKIDKEKSLFGNELSPVWFLVRVGGTTFELFSLDEYLEYAATEAAFTEYVYLVTESIQQRHTFLAKLSNTSTNMQVNFEFTQHVEGVPEVTHYGFIQKSNAQLVNATSPLELIQKMPTERIFSNYQMKREQLIDLIHNEQVRGLWSDTLFPMLKNLVAYGADELSGDTITNMVEAALDATLVTLSLAAPELAPVMVGLKEVMDKPTKSAAQKVIDAAKRWAIKGHALTLTPSPRITEISTTQLGSRDLDRDLGSFSELERD